jgi:N-methylhydantoinase A/oxoprolinase/acetone carboxylase beta subunit
VAERYDLIRVGVDVGGTFTDFIMMDDSAGRVESHKLSTTPKDPSIAVVEGLKAFSKEARFDIADIDLFFHSTTITTNILVEHKGASTGLITTKGFRDVLTIARHKKPLNFSIQQIIPWHAYPLVPRRHRYVVEERIIPPDGQVLIPLNEQQVRDAAGALKKSGVEAVAICFLHSYLNPVHEKRAKEIVQRDYPQAYITCSHEVVNQYREFERFNTACLNCYVGPKTSSYVDHLAGSLEHLGLKTRLHLMQSNGGTITPQFAKVKPLTLARSGPSAGMIAGLWFSELLGIDNVITFDMGGTTTLVGVSPKRELQFEHLLDTKIEGYQAMIPTVDVEAIGNGGGSVSWVDAGGAFRVGPRSAGADPGPACYGRGGKDPTTTDAFVILGLIDPNYFLGGRMKLDIDLAKSAFEEKICRDLKMNVETAALSTFELAIDSIVRAMEVNSVRKGYDPREFTLFGFGGAGPMMAAKAAQELLIQQIVIPPLPGITSAGALLTTDIRYEESMTEITVADQTSMKKLDEGFQALEGEVRRKLREDMLPEGRQRLRRYVECRYVGQGYELKVPFGLGTVTKESISRMIKDFNKAHERQYLRSFDKPVEIVNLIVIGSGKMPKLTVKVIPKGSTRPSESALKRESRILFRVNGRVERVVTPRYERSLLKANNEIEGPAIVEQIDSTTLIPEGMVASVERYGSLLIRRSRRLGE